MSMVSKTPKRGSGSTTSSAPSHEHSVSESRRRQSKRDEAIRRKIENDLSKKRRSKTKSTKHRKGSPGTVLSLKPSDPIICKPNSTVYEVSQLMSAKRENCILVVGDSNELLGIFTAKDLAFRIVGAGLNANTVTIDQIMTPNPMCANSATPASDALNLMVQKGFRHLPVLDDENQIVGVLDITKCYAQQMEKLERMHSSSKKLYEALDSVHNEMGVGQQPLHIFKYFEDLKAKMNGPTLESVLDASTTPVYTNVKSSVYEATVLMKEHHTTAVLVKDTNEDVTGIFTSKDVVLRVIAAGLDPKKCSIVRVMTPQPDVASKDLSIQEALRQMFDGHYLNLPVVEDDEIIGIVEVLKLTYATLNQIKNVQTYEDNENEHNEGPAWNKFWTSLDNDSDSVHSDSILDTPDITQSEFQAFNVDNIQPSDSISFVNASQSNLQFMKQADEYLLYSFKFKSPINRIHRISLKPSEGVERLRSLIDEKFNEQEFELLGGTTYSISYIDDEGDIVAITSDQDLIDCVSINKKLNNDKADLFVHNSSEPLNISLPPQSHGQSRSSGKTDDTDEKQIDFNSNEFIVGLPNEVLLSGALAALAASIIIVFTFSRK